MKKVKANDEVQRKKPAKAAMKKPAKAAMKRIVMKKPAKAAMKTKTKAKPKNNNEPKYYTAAFVEGLNCEFIVHTTDSSTETLCKVYYSKERKGLEFRYYKSFRPA